MCGFHFLFTPDAPAKLLPYGPMNLSRNSKPHDLPERTVFYGPHTDLQNGFDFGSCFARAFRITYVQVVVHPRRLVPGGTWNHLTMVRICSSTSHFLSFAPPAVLCHLVFQSVYRDQMIARTFPFDWSSAQAFRFLRSP